MMETRCRFTNKLLGLSQHILKMGALVEQSLSRAVAALELNDEELADSVIHGDDQIDAMQAEIEDAGTRLIATEQPVAGDLRMIIAALKLCADLGRIGDHARHLATAVSQIPAPAVAAALPRIQAMAEVGRSMVHDSLTAFVEHDAEAAIAVAARDNQIDEAHHQLYGEILTMMNQRPDQIDAGISLLFVNRFLERLGDHVTNMCKWVVYAIHGEHIELNA